LLSRATAPDEEAVQRGAEKHQGSRLRNRHWGIAEGNVVDLESKICGAEDDLIVKNRAEIEIDVAVGQWRLLFATG
jgi:hypothetical protein